MLPYRDSRLTQIALGLFFLAVAAYAYFEVRGLLFGPHIFVASETMETHDQFVKITGRADHIASLTIDGAPVAVTTAGAFEIPYLLAPGVNRIELEARDNYKHSVSKTLEIVYVPKATSAATSSATTMTHATSTVSASTTPSIPNQ